MVGGVVDGDELVDSSTANAALEASSQRQAASDFMVSGRRGGEWSEHSNLQGQFKKIGLADGSSKSTNQDKKSASWRGPLGFDWSLGLPLAADIEEVDANESRPSLPNFVPFLPCP
jgi:hypothetical protein